MYSEIITILDQNPDRLKRVLSCLPIEKQIEVLRQCKNTTQQQVVGVALTEFCAGVILPAVVACGAISVLNYFGSQQG
ncbi:MAG TPA: hypothetical protein PKW79_07590 [Rhabdochlamydiaceae bacterium]|nr:hypothetical protein [Rhabdochlamydiaceae bacterium]